MTQHLRHHFNPLDHHINLTNIQSCNVADEAQWNGKKKSYLLKIFNCTLDTEIILTEYDKDIYFFFLNKIKIPKQENNITTLPFFFLLKINTCFSLHWILQFTLQGLSFSTQISLRPRFHRDQRFPAKKFVNMAEGNTFG